VFIPLRDLKGLTALDLSYTPAQSYGPLCDSLLQKAVENWSAGAQRPDHLIGSLRDEDPVIVDPRARPFLVKKSIIERCIFPLIILLTFLTRKVKKRL
jgi:hypothetical protein